jgi:hypothetical protein
MKQIPLTKNQFALVDDDLFDYLSQWKWHCNGGYAERKENGKHIRMHRVILKTKRIVDHRNGDALDNRRENLRPATKSSNAMNMRKHRGLSKYKGVSKEGNHWRVQICINNKRVFSESAPTERLAGMVYDLNAPIYFGEYARLNFQPAANTVCALR